MDRKEFIIKAGMFAGVCACAGACVLPKGEQIEPKKEEKIDFTIDLTNSKFADLQKIGGFVYEKLIIIVRKGDTEFLAFTQYCTHASGVIKFIAQKNHFECPVHYSQFDLEGKVIQSPAINPLKKYKTERNGNLLRIFE
ncbi:MAG: Rieske (2Fe-2S) protein [Thermoflexibacter sp.]|jgi:cytochrome b6-f complex iron-sulfur subunit|nr:Rieske (2Fe-2S) protein [Thermoflexibacter sp.]